MSKITKNISRLFIASSFIATTGFILWFAFFAFAMAIPGSSRDGGFLLQAVGIIILVGGTLIVLLALLHRFLWRFKIH